MAKQSSQDEGWEPLPMNVHSVILFLGYLQTRAVKPKKKKNVEVASAGTGTGSGMKTKQKVRACVVVSMIRRP